MAEGSSTKPTQATPFRVDVLEIQNFKSIRHLRVPCRRVNVFIGRPNTGKSNILESLGLLSVVYEANLSLHRLVRFETLRDLFFDQEIRQTVRVTAGPAWYIINYNSKEMNFTITSAIYERPPEPGKEEAPSPEVPPDAVRSLGPFRLHMKLSFQGHGSVNVEGPRSAWPFKFYRFMPVSQWDRPEPDFLLPPDGRNLLAVLQTHPEVRRWVAGLFQEFGLKLVLKPHENLIEFQKEIDGVVYAFPYRLASDTLQRLVLYWVAIETNRDSVILLEEPEAHAFPFYTKHLAERIALDKSNQYFLSTHNPYFLLALIEKVPRSDLAVFRTGWKDYETRVRLLRDEELREILDQEIDVFFNLDRFGDDG